MYIMPFIPQYISFIEGSNYAVKWNQKLKVMEKKKPMIDPTNSPRRQRWFNFPTISSSQELQITAISCRKIIIIKQST